MKTYLPALVSLTLLLVLSSCRNTLPLPQANPEPVALSQHYPLTADAYLQKAQSASGEPHFSYTLLAVGRLLQDGSQARAKQILDSLDDDQLSNELNTQKYLLSAQIAEQAQQPNQTLEYLSHVRQIESLPELQRTHFHNLRARAYLENHQPLESIRERITLSQVLTQADSQNWNRDLIWKTLQHSDEDLLKTASHEQSEDELQAWLALAYSIKHNEDGEELTSELKDWQQQHPNHAGSVYIPQHLRLRDEDIPKNLALLLPLHGNLAKPGNAIRDGFMAAYFAAKQNGQNIRVKIYDSSRTKDIKSLYDQVTKAGANFVIGPLSKDNVTTLAKNNFQVPTLSLNYTNENLLSPNNLYQFGLSPQDEALQVAIKAFQDGKRNAVLIYPGDKWGANLAETFQTQWQHLGGSLIGSLAYQNKTNLNQEIRKLLQIDKSQARKKNLQNIVKESLQFIPRRRQDIDMIFLIAKPKIAQQIQPLLKFHYAGDVAVYANSLIYQYSPNGNKDIDGITFCDIPWLLDPEHVQQISKNMSALAKHKSSHFSRLYALGYDSLQIALKLNQLQHFPEIGMPGATGRLYLDPRGRIRRELIWAKVDNGKVQPVLM